MDDLTKTRGNDLDSLERPAAVVTPTVSSAATSNDSTAAASLNDAAPVASAPPPTTPHRSPIRRFISSLNIYLLLFLVLLVVAGVVGTVIYLKEQAATATNNSIGSQQLGQSTLSQLSNSNVTVGEPQHTLSVQSNAVFTGSVLVRSNLQVTGALQVGSNLAINGIRVTGNSTFDDVQVTKSLAVTGSGSFQGQLNVQNSLNVNGSGTFQGAVSAPSLTVGTLQLNGDINITHHLNAGGGTPGRTTGTALGTGGTTSVSGSDTAGSVTINTGANPAVGCFITINFSTKFNATPHIVVTPVGEAAAGLQYYITRSTSSFSICTATAATGSATFGFDYIAFD